MTGEQVKKWRGRWGLSQAAAARALRTSQAVVSFWEHGIRSVPSRIEDRVYRLEHDLEAWPADLQEQAGKIFKKKRRKPVPFAV